MFYFLRNLLISLIIEQFLVQGSLTNQYTNYRLYSVRMPANYELTNSDELFISTQNDRKQSIDLEPNTVDNDKQNHTADQKVENNLFHNLMDRLVNQVPIDIWQLSINYSLFTVSPQYYLQVEDYLLNNSLNFDLLDDNIQNRLNSEQQEVFRGEIFNMHQNINSSFNLTLITLSPRWMNDYFRYLAKRYPDTVRVNTIGKTFENRDILAITIRKKSHLKRPVVIIDAGIHAREWITHASALVLISKLVYYFNMDASHTVLDQLAFEHNITEANLVEPVDWVIIPVLNPDGYVHTWLHDRLYRKNRAVPRTKPRRLPWNFFSECIGVDLNRNFEYYFAYSAHSSNPCNEIFAGDSAFSELESSALRTLILSIKPQAYISLHSFSQLITYPNKIDRSKLPHHDQLKEVARKMSTAIKELENRDYRFGQISQFNYGVIGDSVGWSSMNGVNLTYRIDLRDKGSLGYNIPRNQIVSNGEELLRGLCVIADEIKRSFKGDRN